MNVLILFLVALSVSCVRCGELAASGDEARGKGKYALLIHFFYVVATKLFILKIVYGIIFYILLTKGWHFVLWFIHYLKQNKHEEYIEHEPIYHDHGHEIYHGYGAPYHGGGGPYHGGDGPYHGGGGPYHGDSGPYHGYESYDYDKNGYETNNYVTKKKIYDSDGSYSVNKPVVAGNRYSKF
ncbi:uncharacterized protein LOC114357672 [Ostrinia furnacalis]|uniref:uncharacterized protein LOC114357672 n=1 Tax=Ostrinia furnacalis TaxID=93504 RepID=UPI00103EECE1|nr:uncharacterized protein LOC114357672 [Ostrinia furnacalis]